MTPWFVYEWEKPTRQKPHRVIFRSPLPKFHYYHNKRLQVKESQFLIPTYIWTISPIPNWTCSVVTISHFDARFPSTWLTNCADPSTQLQSSTREDCWLQSFLVHHTMKIEKLFGYKTLWCTSTAAFSQERWTWANSVSSHNLLEQTLLNICTICSTFDSP